MTILTGDIKILKSAVMADTTDGGGAMTGTAVVDGQSNNLFPDTSAMDRAFGRVNFRKVFGVAHSDDTDTLMGAHAILTDAPEDPLVHCALLKTAGWADTLTTAREVVERYLVKGPRLPARLYDAHYAGALSIKLVSFVNGAGGFPESGDCIVLRNTAGKEQYVRIVKITIASEVVAVVENGATLVLQATVATCQIGQSLQYDFDGPPPSRVIDEAAWTQVYTTSVAGGAKFYGIKPLASAAAPGDYSATVAGGIFTPLVPAATVESPVIDRFPLIGRSAVCATANAPVTLSAARALDPGAIIALPTAIEPQSLTFTHGSTTFTTDSSGAVKQGAQVVGAVDHAGGRVVMDSAAPSYGYATLSLTYKPGSSVGASPHSAAYNITAQNQGLAFTNVFEPPPAPGSFSLGYMAQGRWYELLDNLGGKLSGADSDYGVGTLNYATGSMGVTLGAIPDVGSALIATWGDGASAKALTGALPAKLSTRLTLPPRAKGEGITVTWSRGGSNYTATTNAAGNLAGHATGYFDGAGLRFEPGVFPDGDVSVTCAQAPLGSSQIELYTSGGGTKTYRLTAGQPIVPGSFGAGTTLSFDEAAVEPFAAVRIFDSAGTVYARYKNAMLPVGTLNYTTGDLVLSEAVTVADVAYRDVTTVPPQGWNAGAQYVNIYRGNKNAGIGSPAGVSYAYGSTSVLPAQAQTPGEWTMQLPTGGAQLATTGLTFTLGADLYTASSGTLRRGWGLDSGAPSVAAAGAVSSGGAVTVSALPSDFVNAVAWCNAAINLSGGQVSAGVFRTDNAPLKAGVFQLQVGASVAQGNSAGVLSGGDFWGSVDYQRGIVKWAYGSVFGQVVNPADLSYNAVFLQYLPLDASLLGIETARLPLDGKVPVYRPGDLCVVHNTQTLTLTNPVPRNIAQSLGRERIASVRVKDALGAVVPDTLYTTALDAGTITVPSGSDLTAYAQPLKVEHRIEDMVVCSQADISGKLSFISRITHDYPPGTSFVSSALPFGDLFARSYGHYEQETWTGEWSDALIVSAPLASFNHGQYPIVMTNRGAITERWSLIFTASTAFRIVGESVGIVGTGTTSTDCAPVNPATGAPYFSVPALGWGSGWAPGNLLRFNTDACGAPFWPVRTVLQGPAALLDDQSTIAFRGDVDRP